VSAAEAQLADIEAQIAEARARAPRGQARLKTRHVRCNVPPSVRLPQ
jgi:hypothetical protein